MTRPHHQVFDASRPLTLEDIRILLHPDARLELSDGLLDAVAKCRKFLDDKLAATDQPIYGINTGFGALYDKEINKADLEKLQENLVKSHACGLGAEVPEPVVRLMIALKVRGLGYGKSAVQVATITRLRDFFNQGLYPVVYEQGSLGASGDLAPLAHLSLPLIGLGEFRKDGKKINAADVLGDLGWEKIHLQSKEGLALLNGTQFMSAYGMYVLHKAERLSRWADFIAALSLEGFDGRIEPFNDLLHQARPHKGQIGTAAFIRQVLEGSSMISRKKAHVQDPYSFRCIPQVHGASKDALDYVLSVFLTEINAVTDNPTVFPDEDLVISGGNFHGQPLAITLDFLAIAMAELGSISERRIYQLINGNRGLPGFLAKDAGLNSGFMIAQYAAAAVVSQNKQLCTPASVDTIDSSRGQEDHVSMGANAATKALRIVENLEQVLAVELLTAAQAMDFRRPAATSPALEKLMNAYRDRIPFIETDVVMKAYMDESISFIRRHDVSEFISA